MFKAGLVCLISLVVSAPVYATSFDCAKASTEVERLICADPELSKLDDGLGALYKKMLSNASRQTVESQRNWLNQVRNVCQSSSCLKAAYESRINELNAMISTNLMADDNTTSKSESLSTVVFSMGKGTASVNLKSSTPMYEGLRAILAMYTLQNGAGCEGPGDPLPCALTDALDLGGQCSSKHVNLVRTWFKESIPKMSGYAEQNYKNIGAAGRLESICYLTPFTATFQQTWNRIQITKNGNRILVDANLFWLAREKSGETRYVSEYEISDDSIKIVSHKTMY